MAKAKAVYDIEARDRTGRTLDSVNARFGGLGRNIESMLRRVGFLFASVFSVSAVTAKFSDLIRQSDELEESARAVSSTVADLGEGAFKFETSGSDAETYARALDRLQIALAEAKAEGGKLGEALAIFGFSRGQNVEDTAAAFQQIQDEFTGTAKQVTALSDIFGARLAAAIITVLKNARDASDQIDKFRELGVFDPTIKGAEELLDRTLAIKLLYNKILTEELEPFVAKLNEAAEAVEQILTAVRELQKEGVDLGKIARQGGEVLFGGPVGAGLVGGELIGQAIAQQLQPIIEGDQERVLDRFRGASGGPDRVPGLLEEIRNAILGQDQEARFGGG